MRYYPIFLDLKNKPCLVVGGGEVAYRKVLLLLEAGASVMVIAPLPGDEILKLSEKGEILLHIRKFEKGDQEGKFLVIGSTDNSEVNREISDLCQEKNILVNIVDDPILCNFIVPSVFARGDLQIAISSAGKSPALCKRIRRQLEEIFPEDFGDDLENLGELREKIKIELNDGKKIQEFWEEFFNFPLFDAMREDESAIKRKLGRL